MADEITIINPAPEAEPEIVVEEAPQWAQELSSEIRQSNSLQRETLEVLRTQNQLVTPLLETNARLTAQLQETPAAVLEAVAPLLTPEPLEVKPLTDTPPLVDESVPLEASVIRTPEEPPAKARKYRMI
jgi:hypothetical protein